MQPAVSENEFGQPIGFPLPHWTAPPRPRRETLTGRFCRLEPLNPAAQARAVFKAIADADGPQSWTYLPYGPFSGEQDYRAWMERFCLSDDPLFYTIFEARSNQPAGLASYLRIARENGAIEVGHLHFGAQLQRTPAATEAMYLMMQYAFALGYRRYEWKCDALNGPSRAAALRLGFTFEGIWRQAVVYKGRNRDTAWFSVIDRDWPILQKAFQMWLDPENFDAAGQQRTRLSELMRAGEKLSR